MKKKLKKHRSPKRFKKRPISSYRRGINALVELQKKLGKPPKRNKVPKYVDELIKEAGLKGDSLEYYFRLYATCALMNKESMCRNWEA